MKFEDVHSCKSPFIPSQKLALLQFVTSTASLEDQSTLGMPFLISGDSRDPKSPAMKKNSPNPNVESFFDDDDDFLMCKSLQVIYLE